MKVQICKEVSQVPAALSHIAIDEAGRGCLAGPVVAAAVLMPEGYEAYPEFTQLDDSKKLTERQRATLVTDIRAKAVVYGIGFAWQREIDRVNILRATFLAMGRAVKSLICQSVKLTCKEASMFPLIVDGNHPIAKEALVQCGVFPCAQYALIDGDALLPSVSAASVLAKTTRDQLLERLDARYPGYGLAKHKGYGTKQHLEALKALGPSRLHRLSFKGVLPAAEEQLRLF